MAVVRLSTGVIEGIMNMARNKMQVAVDRAVSVPIDQSWGRKIYEIMFGTDTVDIVEKLPAGWCKRVEILTVIGIKLPNEASLGCNLDFKFVDHISWPEHWPTNKFFTHHYGSRVHMVGIPNGLEAFYEEVKERQIRIVSANKRKEEFVAEVRKVLGAYSTLAPALKAWPSLWDLVPEGTRDTHRLIVEREKKEVVLDVNLDKLTAMTAAAKFGV